MIHRLDPLLRPQSIAVVGASSREGSPGNETLVNLLAGNYAGPIYPVNPGSETVMGLDCFASLSAIPAVPQHVVFVVNDQLVEPLLDEAIALGVQACTIFSALELEEDGEHSRLRERVQDKIRRAGMLMHGANCMGFFNFRDGVRVSGFDTRVHSGDGAVTLLSQSGAGMSGIMDCEQRIRFNFAASTGQELSVSMEDYLDFALDLPETRVVGLFLETSRHPDKFIQALQKAKKKRIPIVVIKVGKTELAARLAVSHSGALAGSDGSYQAVFDRFGVQRVDDMAQLATTLIMFSQAGSLDKGGLVGLHDSGGERQLAIDLAAELEVPYTPLAEATVETIERIIDPGLPIVNPLDAWGRGGAGATRTMNECFSALVQDPGAAMGVVVHDRAPGGQIYPGYIEYLQSASRISQKPVFLVANHQGSGADDLAVESTLQGLPVIDGLREFLVGARALMSYRDFLANQDMKLPVLDTVSLAMWQERFYATRDISESEASQCLNNFGIPVLQGLLVETKEHLIGKNSDISYPVVLKTAMPGIAHKTEQKGVALNIRSPEALLSAYDDMSERLGPKVLLLPMFVEEGVEMILGVSRDPQFGPMVVMGIGGIYTELLRDAVVVLAPFDAATARRAIDSLKLRALLDEFRGREALDVGAFCEAASRLSVLAHELRDCVHEIDVNPVKLTAHGVMGLDTLLITSSVRESQAKKEI